MILAGGEVPWRHQKMLLNIINDYKWISPHFYFNKKRQVLAVISLSCITPSCPIPYRGSGAEPLAGGCWVPHGDAAGHRQGPMERSCHAGKSDKDKGNAHHTMRGDRIRSQSPFNGATVTSPLLLQCPVTFFWYLGLSTFLSYRARLPWCISYLQGKSSCHFKEDSVLRECQWGMWGREERTVCLLGIQIKGTFLKSGWWIATRHWGSTACPRALSWVIRDWAQGPLPKSLITELRWNTFIVKESDIYKLFRIW